MIVCLEWVCIHIYTNLGGTAEDIAFVPGNRDRSFFYCIKIYLSIRKALNVRKEIGMNITSFEETRKYAKEYNFVPVAKEVMADVVTPINILKKIATSSKNFYLLESVEASEVWSRYSFLGFKPILRIYGKEGKAFLVKEDYEKELRNEAVLELKNLIASYKAPKITGMPSFTGGLVGYFAYEMIGYAEPKLNLKANKFNDYDLMLFDKVIVYDHLKQKLYIIANINPANGIVEYNKAVSNIEDIENLIFNDSKVIDTHFFIADIDKNPEFTCDTSKEEYEDMVKKTINYIYEGDIFQAVVSRRFEADYRSSLLNTYRVLRTTNPSPYMYFINIDGTEIAGASPETMVKLENNELTTFPVAGTRKRGATDELDKALEKELLADEKELAEHNMLVDLARNDVGRISEYGSVFVKDYMKIHRFSKVMHIASTVKGTLHRNKKSYDAITALLPAGTLSGAPKYRACQIIDELEKESRGVYGGAIGYIDFSGNLDVCIAIRTAVRKDNKVYVQAGAGIVADSIPEKEYEECANKAGAVIDAIKRAGEVK